MDPSPPIPRIVQPTVRPSDGHGMLDTEPNGQVKEELIATGPTGMIAHHVDARGHHTARVHIGRPAGRTTHMCPAGGVERYEVRVVHRIVHPARWNLQNVAIPFIIQPKLARVPRNNRSSRKMLTRNDPMVAHIAPIAFNGGIRK